MASGKSNSCRVVISLIYIIIGVDSLVPSVKSALGAALDLDLIGILSASAGILMLLAGLFGILDVKRGVCRTMGIVILQYPHLCSCGRLSRDTAISVTG